MCVDPYTESETRAKNTNTTETLTRHRTTNESQRNNSVVNEDHHFAILNDYYGTKHSKE